MNAIKNILHDNEYNTNVIGKPPPSTNKTYTLTPSQKTKWVTTYSGKRV
jgi:hypothetical protein